jgi:hypothetical protein
MAHVYWCKVCQKKYRFIELRKTDLDDWADQWEERRQSWIREMADLKQKLYWMSQPATYAEKRLIEVRAKLIKLIERTF